MEVWTAIVSGLVVIPVVALLYVVRDLFDAYADLEIVSSYRPQSSIEYLYARHALISQASRAAALVLLAVMPLLALLNVSSRNNIVILFYGVSGILAWDAVRTRRARKRRIELLEASEEEPNYHTDDPSQINEPMWPESTETS